MGQRLTNNIYKNQQDYYDVDPETHQSITGLVLLYTCQPVEHIHKPIGRFFTSDIDEMKAISQYYEDQYNEVLEWNQLQVTPPQYLSMIKKLIKFKIVS